MRETRCVWHSTVITYDGPLATIAIAVSLIASPALAQSGARCHGGQSFDQFLAQLKQDAVADGSRSVRSLPLPPAWCTTRASSTATAANVSSARSSRNSPGAWRPKAAGFKGQQLIQTYAQAFARAEKEYGVPPAVITAFWALESDFGAVQGKLPTLRSLVSLAYDCRRSEMFRQETIAALKIIDRRRSFAERDDRAHGRRLGQTQFLPRHYFDYAVDYDGDGHRNMLRSAPDVIGSTANYIANGLKWRRGEPWLQEIRVPANLESRFPWDQADLTIKHPRSKWAAWGVTYADGRPLPKDELPASVLLPMGRTDPRFSLIRISPLTPNGITR